MTGQDAVQTAEAFHETLQIDGVIMSKLDGDARGGAALSVKEVIGRPIAFASTGEKLDEFEQFHPDRMAGRILGMGDMLTLIEQAEQAFEAEQAEAGRGEADGGRVHARRLPRADAAAQEDGAARQPDGDDARDAQGAQGRQDRRRRPQADRGDHPLDDPEERASPRSSTAAAGRASPPGRARRSATSTGSSSSSARCRR